MFSNKNSPAEAPFLRTFFGLYAPKPYITKKTKIVLERQKCLSSVGKQHAFCTDSRTFFELFRRASLPVIVIMNSFLKEILFKSKQEWKGARILTRKWHKGPRVRPDWGGFRRGEKE